jgi:hypothetical protein
MLNEPIQKAADHLWHMLSIIGHMRQVPANLMEELVQIEIRLNAYVIDLRAKKAKLDAARADLELI